MDLTLEFRTLARDEIDLIWTIDRREMIENIYRLEAGKLHLEPHHFDVPGWPPDTALTMMPLIYESFDRGGEFFGAFDAGALVGVSGIDIVWRGPRGDLLQLEVLHVSRDCRSQGVGTRLFEQARDAARARGARGLYISATPTENTIHFYQGRGSVLIESPDPELYAREPEDIHLECPV